MLQLPCECGNGVDYRYPGVGMSLRCAKCGRINRLIANGPCPGFVSARLTLVSGPKRTNEIVLLGGGKTIHFGKQSDQTFVLLGSLVSRVHGRFEPTQAGWRVVDDNSATGLFVNGRRVAGADLRTGDKVRIGEYEFAYALLKPPVEEPSVPVLRASVPVGADEAIPLVADEPDDLEPVAPQENDGDGLLGFRDDPTDPKRSDPRANPVRPGIPIRVTPAGATPSSTPPIRVAPSRDTPIRVTPPGAPSPSPLTPPMVMPMRVEPIRMTPPPPAVPKKVLPIPSGSIVGGPLGGLAGAAAHRVATGPVCPACKRQLDVGALICVNCGIHIVTGKPIVISKGLDEDVLEERTDRWVRRISRVVPMCMLPVASEAFGTKQPLAIMSLAILTCLTSLIVFFGYHSADPAPLPIANLMLWHPDGQWPAQSDPSTQPTALVTYTFEGEELPPGVTPDDAFELSVLMQEDPGKVQRGDVPEHLKQPLVQLATYGRPHGRFRPSQLLTHAFIHDVTSPLHMVVHLAGNLLFMLVFGLRVNELIGSAKTAVTYVLLAVASGAVYLWTRPPNPLHLPNELVGASGAIMGLAGMYLVLFPVQRVYMVYWFRFFIVTPCYYWLFALRGFWLLLFWILYTDVLPVLMGDAGDVAHWAHLGGFVTGIIVAVILLVTRTINAMGSDIFSVTLGRWAWPIVGKPRPIEAAPPNADNAHALAT